MKKKPLNYFIVLLVGFAFVAQSPFVRSQEPKTKPEPQYSKVADWHEKKVSEYEELSKTNPPPTGCTMFVGSSTWTGWGKTFDKDFEGMNAVNRGFGGAVIPEWFYALDRLVTPYKPARIMFFCGTNDLNSGHSPERVVNDFKKFLSLLRETNPDCMVFYVAITKSHSRKQHWERMDQVNDAVKEMAENDDHLVFIDINTPMYDEDGVVREEFFGDRLHLNRKGQLLWIPILREAYFSNENGKNKGTKNVVTYTTTADQKQLFERKEIAFDDSVPENNHVRLFPETVHQVMDGFGAAITGSSCYNLLKMTPEDRRKILMETFDVQTGMGYGYIRISIGCSDFSLSEFTCCDKPGIENFAIHEEDEKYLIPILKEILEINPKIKIMASPWTCPKWMKVDNLKELKPFDSWTSGQLNPKYYQDYATYFLNYVQEMKKRGIEITSITLQNEPLNRGNSASLFMSWQEQRDFIKTALGPTFKKAGLKTEIIVFDHNYNYDRHKPDCKDQVGYPLHIYEDKEAAQYVVGAAYHAYGGNKDELIRIHEAYPDKNLYFTEISIGTWSYSFASDLMWNAREVCIGTIARHSKAVIVWNFMLDEKHAPFRPGGCDKCMGAVDIDSRDYKTLTKNSHFYTIGHLSKVIAPGANRIESQGFNVDGLYHVAFINPDKGKAFVVQNDTDRERKLTVAVEGDSKSFTVVLPPKSVVSCKW